MIDQVAAAKTADVIATSMTFLVRKRKRRAEVIAAVLKLQKSMRAACPQCKQMRPISPFVRADIKGFILLARRGSLISLRRRIVDQLLRAPLVCPECNEAHQDRGDHPVVSTHTNGTSSCLAFIPTCTFHEARD